ncbi:MAG: hypothetical protein O2960_23010 [Verrucomicrobia bacterium]|nr:hypothetical protein [Verrucomicrobiota bacterium]
MLDLQIPFSLFAGVAVRNASGMSKQCLDHLAQLGTRQSSGKQDIRVEEDLHLKR